jgi:hypothetical protein
MKVRRATEQDKLIWDSFMADNDGNLYYYFDWIFCYSSVGIQHNLLIIESEDKRVIGICPLLQVKSRLIVLGNKVSLFRNGLSHEDISSAISVLLSFINTNYSSTCSSLTLCCEGAQNIREHEGVFLKHGFKLRSDGVLGLHCAHLLPLKLPFEEAIYKDLWSQKFRQSLNKVSRSEIKVIVDKEYKYLNEFLDMLTENFRRHHTLVPNRELIIAEINTFREKTKLFVALKDNRPIVILRCFYTPSTCTLWQVGSYTKDTSDVNKYVYRIAIEDACDSGCKYVSFGESHTVGLARLKDRFRATRIPVNEYEKRYSTIKTILEWAPFALHHAVHDPIYLWEKRKTIVDRLINF